MVDGYLSLIRSEIEASTVRASEIKQVMDPAQIAVVTPNLFAKSGVI